MKNYIPLLVSLVYASAAHAVGLPTKIRSYNSFNDAQQQNANYTNVDLEQDSTTNYVRDELLRELGAGHLMIGTQESFSAEPNSNEPLKDIYGGRPKARTALENTFSYWRFDFKPAELNAIESAWKK